MEAQSIPNIIRTAVRLSPPWTLPLWLFIAMVLVGIVITAYLLLHRHRVWASICGALRLIALLILLFLMARPIWQRSTIREQPATIVIALDTSKSMTLPMDNATHRRRIDSALKLLFGEHDNPQGSIDSEVQRRAKDASVKMQSKAKTSLIAHLKGRFQVELYRFDEDAVLLTGRAKFDHPKANGRMTDLRKLLVAVKRNVPRRKLAGIILLTDGADNCARDEREIVATARALGVPVFAIGFGAVHHQRELTPNLSIAEVLSNERVIAGSTVRAIVTVRANHVNTPTSVRVILRKGLKSIAERSVRIGGRWHAASCTFEFNPGAVGKHRFAVMVQPLPDEVDKSDNAKTFDVTVSSPKIRVLYIEGRLRWDYKFLRRILLRDPNVTLTSIIRTAPQKLYEQGQVPIGGRKFPSSLDALCAFDAVIIGDVGRRYFSASELEMLRQYVAERGGGLVLLGGELSLGSAGFAGTPLARALPVMLSDGSPIEGAFSLTPTARARKHPIFAGFTTAGLPQLDISYRVGQAKPGAIVLARHPRTGGIVMAVQHYGKGKVVLLAAEGFWRWEIKSPTGWTPYTRFWGQILRWLYTPQRATGTRDNIVRLYAPPERVNVGDMVTLRAGVYTPDYAPVRDAKLLVRIVSPDGQVSIMQMKPVAGALGEYEFSFTAKAPGRYSFTIGWTKKELIAGTHRGTVQVVEPELAQASLNESLLKRVAEVTNGAYVHGSDVKRLAQLPMRLPTKRVRSVRVESQPLWDKPWLFIAFVALLTIEWTLRKRKQWM